MTTETDRNPGITEETGETMETPPRFTVKRLVDGLGVNELVRHGVSLRRDVYERLGIVDREAYEAMQQRVDAVERRLDATSPAGQSKPAGKAAKT